MVPVPLSHNRYRTPSAASAVPRLIYISLSLLSKYALQLLHPTTQDSFPYSGNINSGLGGRGSNTSFGGLARRSSELDDAPHWKRILFPILIPFLVLLSGVFAGLTLGYMSLDETQLNVLSISGTLKQREYASKIMPIRKNGHLLLVTLLLANMIVNETLPVIADTVLGGGFQSVVVSTVLIVIFAEIIPQSLFTRHGLYLGAKMAWFTRILIYGLGFISWPVAKLLELVLGKHHGIIYRRGELKELIAMHDADNVHGGDLKTDTVTIIGATLDLQEKVVRQAMTPIADVFMVSIESKLDFDLLKKICQTGHSRVPVYEEVEVPLAAIPLGAGIPAGTTPSVQSPDGPRNSAEHHQQQQQRMVKVKKIVGVLLVKHCVLLDPRNATPIRKIPLNKVPFIPNNEPLLGMLDKFQEGRSHMAIVSRYSVEKAQSVKKAVKRGLTKRLRASVGMGDTDSSSTSSSSSSSCSSSSSDDEETDSATSGMTYVKKLTGGKKKRSSRRQRKLLDGLKEQDIEATASNGGGGGGNGIGTPPEDGLTVVEGEGGGETLKEDRRTPSAIESIEMTTHTQDWGGTGSSGSGSGSKKEHKKKSTGEGNEGDKRKKKKDNNTGKKTAFQLSPLSIPPAVGLLEQSMPADAVLAKEGADEFLQSIDPAVMPLGIITLEDVLEELIGEEIYDEFDPQGAHGDPYAYDVPAPTTSTVPPPPGVGPPHSTVVDTKHPVDETTANLYPDTHGTVILPNNAPAAPVPGTTTTGTAAAAAATATTPAVIRSMPIQLPGISPMLRGLGFLTRRSKSAPPLPRNKRKPRPTNENEGGGETMREKDRESGDEDDDDDDKKQESSTVVSSGGGGGGEETRAAGNTMSAATTTATSGAGATAAVDSQEIKMPRPIRGVPRATFQQLGMTSLTPSGASSAAAAATTTTTGGGVTAPTISVSGTRSLSNSRSASPAPVVPLEAILLERNRRRLAREGSPASGISPTSEGVGAEGGRGRAFKSSPLVSFGGGSSGRGREEGTDGEEGEKEERSK